MSYDILPANRVSTLSHGTNQWNCAGQALPHYSTNLGDLDSNGLRPLNPESFSNSGSLASCLALMVAAQLVRHVITSWWYSARSGPCSTAQSSYIRSYFKLRQMMSQRLLPTLEAQQHRLKKSSQRVENVLPFKAQFAICPCSALVATQTLLDLARLWGWRNHLKQVSFEESTGSSIHNPILLRTAFQSVHSCMVVHPL